MHNIYITTVEKSRTARSDKNTNSCPKTTALDQSTNRLLKLSTVGGRAFPVAGPTIWNSLPDNDDISPVSVNLPSAFKNISVPGLVP